MSANESRIRNATFPEASPPSSSFTAQPCLTKIPCTLFCLVSSISLFKVPCTPVSSMSYRLCSSLSPSSSYTSRQVTVTDPQRVKKAALPQWSTTLPPFLHPSILSSLNCFIPHFKSSHLQRKRGGWRVQDGACTGGLIPGGRLTGGWDVKDKSGGWATACDGRGKCQPSCYTFE